MTKKKKKQSRQVPLNVLREQPESFEEFPSGFFDSKTGIAGKYLMQDFMNMISGKVEPDTNAAEQMFLQYFISEEMEEQFLAIASNFLKRNYGNLEQYEEPWFSLNEVQRTYPSKSIQLKLLNLIYNAAKGGDDYSRKLLVYLYKKYYKQEYNRLKRFRRLHISELEALAEDSEPWLSSDTEARILTICPFLNIEIDPSCYWKYYMFEDRREFYEEYDEEREEFLHLDSTLFTKCSETVDAWINEEKENNRDDIINAAYWDMDRFIGNCFRYNGFPEDYSFLSNSLHISVHLELIRTLALLKTQWPKKEFSYEEVQKYAGILHLAETVTAIAMDIDDDLMDILAIRKNRYSAEPIKEGFSVDEKLGLRPEKESHPKRPVEEPEKPETKKEMMESDAEKDYLNEIRRLRRKLHETEDNYAILQERLRDAKRTITEQEGMIVKYESDREELHALKHSLAQQEELEGTESEVSFVDMQTSLAGRKIIIVGGHPIWVKKLKELFPAWKYVSEDNFRPSEVKNLDGVERLYFFTDHMSHNMYETYIKAAREKKVPFGYIQGVHIESVVQFVYREVCGAQ